MKNRNKNFKELLNNINKKDLVFDENYQDYGGQRMNKVTFMNVPPPVVDEQSKHSPSPR